MRLLFTLKKSPAPPWPQVPGFSRLTEVCLAYCPPRGWPQEYTARAEIKGLESSLFIALQPAQSRGRKTLTRGTGSGKEVDGGDGKSAADAQGEMLACLGAA